MRSTSSAFTLTELLVTMTLLLLLTGMIGFHMSGVRDQEKLGIATEEVHRIRDAVEAMRASTAGPDALPMDVSQVPALASRQWIDPWGRPYAISPSVPMVYSCGQDGLPGTGDDVVAKLSPVRVPAPTAKAVPASRLGEPVLETSGFVRLEAVVLPGSLVVARLDQSAMELRRVDAPNDRGGVTPALVPASPDTSGAAPFAPSWVDLRQPMSDGGQLFHLRCVVPSTPGAHKTGLAVTDASGAVVSGEWRLDSLRQVAAGP